MRQTDGTAPPLCCRHQFARAPMEFSSLDKVGAPAGGQARGPQKPPVCSAATAESAACCPRRADGPAARPAEGGRGQRAPFTGQLHSHGPGAAAVWAARTRPAWERAIALRRRGPSLHPRTFPASHSSWLPRDQAGSGRHCSFTDPNTGCWGAWIELRGSFPAVFSAARRPH